MADQDFNINIRTTADTTGAKQTEAELARIQKEADQTAQQAGANIGRMLAPLLSGFSAFKIVDQLNVVAERLRQTSEQLAKQGEQITENAIKYQELAKGARDEADVIRIASSALKDVEVAHKRVAEAQQEELGWYDKILDSLYHQVQVAGTAGMAAADAGRIANQALDLKIAGERQLADMAQQDLVAAIRSSEIQKAALEKLKAEPLSQAMDELNAKLREQQAILNSIDYTQFPKSWLEASKNVERTKNDLAEILKLKQQAEKQAGKDVSAAYRGASEQAKAIAANEEAAKRAQAAGDSRSADMYQQTAEAYKRGATPAQRNEALRLEQLDETNRILRAQLDVWK